ncbi:MAG: UV DNA damage repair endonuclease UvsE [bacterium]|nr:UV DNA damage repair endonuclease UvsE [bacterium]
MVDIMDLPQLSRGEGQGFNGRLGFAVKVLGEGGLPSHDTRRWQSGPHLRVSLSHLEKILDYLDRNNIRMYRMSSDIAPYLTHPDLTQFHGQLEECSDDLASFGARAGSLDIRLSLHPAQFVVLNSTDEDVAVKAIRDLEAQSAILDVMGLNDEAVVVIHVGGLYGDRDAAVARFIRRYSELDEAAKRRVVLENDERLFGVADILGIHEATGIRLVFDYLHHMLNNPDGIALRPALEACLNTWQGRGKPKIHFSSPRTEMREVTQKEDGRKATKLLPPDYAGHSDYINPFEFAFFLREASGLEFDIMLEAKSKDLALLRLRESLLAPPVI